MSIESQLSKLTANPKNIFLIDGTGALLSAFLLGIVLTRFEKYIGMPKPVLLSLSLIGYVFAAYSFHCSKRVTARWPLFLKIITAANVLYSALTVVLVARNFKSLTKLGVAYFVVELLLMSALIFVEVKVLSRPRKLKA